MKKESKVNTKVQKLKNKFYEFRDKLTVNQSRAISTSVSLLVAIMYGWGYSDSFFSTQEIDFINIVTVSFIAFGVFSVSFLLISTILGTHQKEECMRFERGKEYVLDNYNLCKDNYVELKYRFDKSLKYDADEETLMFLWEKENYTFFAKLTEDDEVSLIIKDIEGNIISDRVVSNFLYLEAFFEPLN